MHQFRKFTKIRCILIATQDFANISFNFENKIYKKAITYDRSQIYYMTSQHSHKTGKITKICFQSIKRKPFFPFRNYFFN